jgi:hypothetical protein
MPEPVAQTSTTFGTGARRGYSAPVSTTVADLSGRQPTSARDVLAANRAVLEEAEPARPAASRPALPHACGR